MDLDILSATVIKKQLPVNIMTKAVKGIGYIGHPLRIRILEFLDVYGKSSVSKITEFMETEQAIISQHLKKMKEYHLLKCSKYKNFVYYEIEKQYPATIFTCIRKLFAIMTDKLSLLSESNKRLLPKKYMIMISGRIKLFANFDKMRILEFLIINGESNVSQITEAINSNQQKVSQYLKRLKEFGFVNSKKNGRFCVYEIIKESIQDTAIRCIHKRYNSLKNKDEF